MFELYMRKELNVNLKYLVQINWEINAKNIFIINDKDDKKLEPLRLKLFVDANKDDYITIKYIFIILYFN